MTDPDLQLAKQVMLRKQLRRRGIHDASVLGAIERVPRERFLPPELRSEAYADRALSIDCDQTISQPYIVALMTQALELSGTETVLEIGTGSGYQTAVLAELAREVITIERHPLLSQQAGRLLDELGCRNVTLLCRDGSLGWPLRSPYDRILITAAAAQCPPTLFDQLGEGGLLVAPLGDQKCQMLQAIRKVQGEARRVDLSPCRFVPLIGAQGWPG
jgi:protein-L-isoaspartate(D-aspartate) O-methyltransferase